MSDSDQERKGEPDAVRFESVPPSFSELVESIMNLWNPRTRTFFTEEEARMLAATAQRRRMK